MHYFQKSSVLNLWKALECEAYTFVTPDSFNYVETGVSLTVSNQCNEDFADTDGDGCAMYSEYGWCDQNAEFHVYYGVTNANGVFETGLNCPQCGCTANGAESLYDRLADSDNRKPFNGPISKQWVQCLYFLYLSETVL